MAATLDAIATHAEILSRQGPLTQDRIVQHERVRIVDPEPPGPTSAGRLRYALHLDDE